MHPSIPCKHCIWLESLQYGGYEASPNLIGWTSNTVSAYVTDIFYPRLHFLRLEEVRFKYDHYYVGGQSRILRRGGAHSWVNRARDLRGFVLAETLVLVV